MLKMIPTLTSTNFEEWLKGLQVVAAQFNWYNPDTKEEWSPEYFDNKHDDETVLERHRRITAYTLIINTSQNYRYLTDEVTHAVHIARYAPFSIGRLLLA